MAAPNTLQVSYTTCNPPPYIQGTQIVIPANIRQTFNATANDEIGGVLCFNKTAPNILTVNGTFIITGVAGTVNWSPILRSFNHNSFMIFHTHPPKPVIEYNGYSAVDLYLLFNYMLLIRRTPSVLIQYALFTPSDIHFTFVDEVCLKMIKVLIKRIRDELIGRGIFQTIFASSDDFTNYASLFFLILFDQVIFYLMTPAIYNQNRSDIASLSILDEITFIPFPYNANTRGLNFLLTATQNFRNDLVSGRLITMQFGDTTLNNVIQSDPSFFQKIGSIATYYFNIQGPGLNSIYTTTIQIKNVNGIGLTQQEHTDVLNSLGLFKSSSIPRASFQSLGINDNIVINCIDNNKIFNETAAWPLPGNIMRIPAINSPIIMQQGGMLTTGSIITIAKNGSIHRKYKTTKTKLKHKTHTNTHTKTHKKTHNKPHTKTHNKPHTKNKYINTATMITTD